jgi:hypothetical protein
MALQSGEFDPHDFVRTFFVPSPSCRITEHGPGWARKTLPFLGQTFQGRDGCVAYFEALTRSLNMVLPHDAFPADEELVVDAEAVVGDGQGGKLVGVVCVVGKGRFESRETGWGGEERFIYKLSGFDEDGRLTHWVGCSW